MELCEEQAGRWRYVDDLAGRFEGGLRGRMK